MPGCWLARGEHGRASGIRRRKPASVCRRASRPLRPRLPPPPPPPGNPSGVVQLDLGQLQLLADVLPRLSEEVAKQGVEVEFTLRMDLDGEVSDDAIEAVNAILRESDTGLQIKR